MKTLNLSAIATAALAVALSACTSLAPHYDRPAAPVAADWPLPTATSGPQAAALSWQNYFADDARLSALIGLALQSSRDLRVAVANAEAARALAGVADANRWPTLGAAYVGTRLPGGNPSQPSNYEAGLQVNAYELDLFGKLKSLDDEAKARYLSSLEGARAARITLISTVAGAHYAWVADDELVSVSSSTLTTLEESLRLTQAKFDAGTASALDLHTAESAAASARVALAQAVRQRDQDVNALTLAVGQPLPADLPAAKHLSDLHFADLPAGLPSQVLVSRPDVLSAEQTLIAANANIGAARADFFPSISLTGLAGTASLELSQLFKHRAWEFVTQGTLPIFDFGRNSSNLAASKAQRDAAQAQYEKAVQTAFREVSDALAGRATLGDQLRAQEMQTAAEQQRLQLEDLRLAQGSDSSFEQEAVERTYFAAQQALIQVRLAKALNQVQLYTALGGGVDAH